MFALFLKFLKDKCAKRQQRKTPPLPEATWGIRILVVWNKPENNFLQTTY
jgi:hypothetical protein